MAPRTTLAMTHHDRILRPSSRKSEAGFSFVRRTQASVATTRTPAMMATGTSSGPERIVTGRDPSEGGSRRSGRGARRAGRRRPSPTRRAALRPRRRRDRAPPRAPGRSSRADRRIGGRSRRPSGERRRARSSPRGSAKRTTATGDADETKTSGRKRTASARTSAASLKTSPAGVDWPVRRASAPSMALRAIRRRKNAATAPSASLSFGKSARTAPIPTERASAAAVRAFGVIPLRAQKEIAGSRLRTNAGLMS